MNKVYVGLLTASIMATVLAPAASALPPGCDWNTDAGVAACMGSGAGSFDNSYTGGDTGDVGYVAAVENYAPELNAFYPNDISEIGKNICRQLQHGVSKDKAKAGLASELAAKGYPTRSASFMVDKAEAFICPPRPHR
jgi:hypothetical protein